jgi:hypothetical protein
LRERKRPPILIGSVLSTGFRGRRSPADNPKVRWASIDPPECGEPQRLFSGALESRPELPFFAVRPGLRCAIRREPGRGRCESPGNGCPRNDPCAKRN